MGVPAGAVAGVGGAVEWMLCASRLGRRRHACQAQRVWRRWARDATKQQRASSMPPLRCSLLTVAAAAESGITSGGSEGPKAAMREAALRLRPAQAEGAGLQSVAQGNRGRMNIQSEGYMGGPLAGDGGTPGRLRPTARKSAGQASRTQNHTPELLGVKRGSAGGGWLRSGDSRSAVAAAAAAACGAAFCVSAGESSCSRAVRFILFLRAGRRRRERRSQGLQSVQLLHRSLAHHLQPQTQQATVRRNPPLREAGCCPQPHPLLLPLAPEDPDGAAAAPLAAQCSALPACRPLARAWAPLDLCWVPAPAAAGSGAAPAAAPGPLLPPPLPSALQALVLRLVRLLGPLCALWCGAA